MVPIWPPRILYFSGYVNLYKMRKSWKFQVNILSGSWTIWRWQGERNLTTRVAKFQISRVNNLFSTFDRALKFSKSKKIQKMYTKYSKWVFQSFQKIHNGCLKIEKTSKIWILGHFRELIISKSHQLRYWKLKIWINLNTSKK